MSRRNALANLLMHPVRSWRCFTSLMSTLSAWYAKRADIDAWIANEDKIKLWMANEDKIKLWMAKHDKIGWYLALHLTFVVSALLLGVLDRLSTSEKTHKPAPP